MRQAQISIGKINKFWLNSAKMKASLAFDSAQELEFVQEAKLHKTCFYFKKGFGNYFFFWLTAFYRIIYRENWMCNYFCYFLNNPGFNLTYD